MTYEMLSTVKKRLPLRLTIKKVKQLRDSLTIDSQFGGLFRLWRVQRPSQSIKSNQTTQIRGSSQTRAHRSGVQAKPGAHKSGVQAESRPCRSGGLLWILNNLECHSLH